jgi:hypothetical protein
LVQKLGLAVCREVCRENHYEIMVTRFRILLY